MLERPLWTRAGALLVVVQLWGARSVWACAVCFSDDDSGLAAGLNAGIAVLLGLALLVQMLVGRFLWRAVKRSRIERDLRSTNRPLGEEARPVR